jgi:uncharacterized protein YraI
MKRFIRGLSLIIAFAAFIGINTSAFAAGSAPPKTEKSSISEVNNLNGVTLTADNQSYGMGDPKIVLTFRNTTETEYDFGVNYSLEVRDGGEWFSYITAVDWPSLGLVLGARKSIIWDIEPAKHLGFLLKAGEYRIVWKIFNTETNQPYFLATEFKIEVPSAAPPASNFQTMKVTSSSLNVRSGAGTAFEVIGLLNKNQLVELMGESVGWLHIRWYDGAKYITGYVSSRYVKKYGPTVYYAKEPVNVRSSPGTGGSITGVLATAEAVTYLKKAGRWFLVEYNGAQGYVYGKYLTKDRKDCFLSYPVAVAIAKKNIIDISYTFAPDSPEDVNTNIGPSLEIVCNVRMRSRNNSLLVTVHHYDSAKTAQQAGTVIDKTAIHPGWIRTFFLKDDTIVCCDLKGMKFTKSEMQLFEGIKNALQALYGNPIILNRIKID